MLHPLLVEVSHSGAHAVGVGAVDADRIRSFVPYLMFHGPNLTNEDIGGEQGLDSAAFPAELRAAGRRIADRRIRLRRR